MVLVLTYDGQSIKLYVNGNLEERVQASGQVIDPVENSSFFIGVKADLSQHFNGHIRDISIWNSTLSALQITSYSSNDFSSNENGLVGYWNFSDGSGVTLSDQTQNDNDGTIVGASWGEVAGSNGVFTYSPNYNFYGSDSFTYTVSDGSATSEEATVSITINSVIDKYYVSSTGSDDNNGSSNNPFETIQAGINAAENSDTVFVAALLIQKI